MKCVIQTGWMNNLCIYKPENIREKSFFSAVRRMTYFHKMCDDPTVESGWDKAAWELSIMDQKKKEKSKSTPLALSLLLLSGLKRNDE